MRSSYRQQSRNIQADLYDSGMNAILSPKSTSDPVTTLSLALDHLLRDSSDKMSRAIVSPDDHPFPPDQSYQNEQRYMTDLKLYDEGHATGGGTLVFLVFKSGDPNPLYYHRTALPDGESREPFSYRSSAAGLVASLAMLALEEP